MNPAFRIALCVGACVCACLPAGCGQRQGAATGQDSGLEQTAERGPHAVVLRLDRRNPGVADRVKLELEVKAAEEAKVVWPVVKGTLGEFQVVDQDESQPELLRDGRTRRVRSYLLEPFLAGAYTIPALEFRFEKPGVEPQRLETAPVKVEVRSLVAEDAKEIHDIAPPVSLRGRFGLVPLLVLAGMALLGGAAWLWWRRRRAAAEAAAAPVRPAHVIAFEQLDALEARDLPGQGLIKACYQELSAILRHYLENRFGVHAPGQTTEEFLLHQSRSGFLEARHESLLREFLVHSDLVKFAELEAGPEQARQAFATCRSFVAQTRPAEEPANPPVEGA